MEWFIIIGLVFANLFSYFFGFIKGLKIDRSEFVRNSIPFIADVQEALRDKQFTILPSQREKEELKLAQEDIPSIQDVLKNQP